MKGIEVEASQRRRRLSRTAWGEMLQRFAMSGESISGFCAREGLSTGRFRLWRARLEGDGSSPQVSNAAARTKASSGFVDLGSLGSVAAPVAVGRLQLTLDLGGGVTLHVVRG